MDCLLVGTGGMAPMPERFLNVLLVRVDGVGYLFDCGEGSQIAMKRWRSGFRLISLLAVSHLHGDHVLGIPGLLMSRTHAQTTELLTILGPPGIQRFVENTVRDLRYHVGFPVEFVEVDPASLADEKSPVELFADDRCRLLCLPLAHNAPCLGFRLEERERPGRFDPRKAKAAGVPRGPQWGALQKGEAVTLEDGTTVPPELVLGPPRRGRAVAFVTDTVPCKGAYRLVDGADIAFVEGMFAEEDFEKSEDKAHMTVRRAARIGRAQSARRTVIVHLSPRYRAEDLPALEEEAKTENPDAELGRDGTWYEVPLPD